MSGSRDIDAILAPFRALGAGEMVPTTAEGKRIIFGVQCHATAVDDSHLPLFLEMPELHALGLSDTNITGAALPVLAKLPCLESLDLDGTTVDDSIIETLSTFPRLEFLHVSRTRISKEGIEALQRLLPRCEIVSDFE